MSEERIDAIKEAQCNFLSFLWKNLICIYELIHEQQYYPALDNLAWLIRGMPEDFQNKFGFREKCNQMLSEIDRVIANGSTYYSQKTKTIHAQNMAAKKALENFLPEFSIMLDRKGYMERKGYPVEYGSESTAP